MKMKTKGVSLGVIFGGAVGLLAMGCASQARQAPAPSSEPAALMSQGEAAKAAGTVVIQVLADCTVDREEAHISESKKEVALWELQGGGGPLGIEFKEEKGKKALEITSVSATAASARIKLGKQQGRHPYRITIGDKECPDPFIIIDP
jgi:hypothetical protein